jgi:hypothetical protein
MEQNKTRYYLKYSIGEILLVMIGILLALQVNNWNENRKTNIQELETLKELRSDLVLNLSDIEENIIVLDECVKSNEIIIYCIDNNKPYHDSLDYHFSQLFPYIHFQMNQTTYENLKQNGLNLISNDSLRKSISTLYAYEFPSYRYFEETYLFEHHDNDIKPMIMLEFTSFDFTSAHPVNYNRFITNPRYRAVLHWTMNMCSNFSYMQSLLKDHVEELIFQIDKVIKD